MVLEKINEDISILVIGDAILDQYYKVKTERISPEFPIPINLSSTDISEDFCGGAANVIYQFEHFNIKSYLAAFLDKDAKIIFNNFGINSDFCININEKIPRKKRFYNKDILVGRWDVEKINYGLIENLNEKCFELYCNIKNIINTFNVVIFSDYNKGVFSNYLHSLISESAISIVDSKCGDINRWIGCTIFKPNAKEALEFTGCKTVQEAGFKLLNLLKCKNVVITEADLGVLIFENNKEIYEIRPTSKLPLAKSVVGAGDTFTAFLAVTLACGMKINDAVKIAFEAGAEYVKNKYNRPITKYELNRRIDPVWAKIISVDELLELKNGIYKDCKWVFNNGCYDILHYGHTMSLNKSRQLGDKLIVALNSDDSVKRLKGENRPIFSLSERAKVIASLECVDFVVSFDEYAPFELIKKINPDVLTKGEDYIGKTVCYKDFEGEIVFIPLIPNVSSTNIINNLHLLS